MHITSRQAGIWAVAAIAITALWSPAAVADGEFIGHGKCKMCHNKASTGEQYLKWTEMKHAKAFESLSSDKAKEYAAAAGLSAPPSESAQCLRCHVSGYDADAAAFHPALAKENGIQCETCHGPGEEHYAFGKAMMKEDEVPEDEPRHIIVPDSSVCEQCHNAESPAWNPEKYTLEDGTTAGFDFDQAFAKIAHLNPEKER